MPQYPLPKHIFGEKRATTLWTAAVSREGQDKGRATYLQLCDDLLLGDFHQLAVLHSECRVGNDREHAGVHLLGCGGPGQHRVEDGLHKGEGGVVRLPGWALLTLQPSRSQFTLQWCNTRAGLTWQCCTSSDSTRITDCGPPFAPKRSSSSSASKAACKQGKTQSSKSSTMLLICKSSYPMPAPLCNTLPKFKQT